MYDILMILRVCTLDGFLCVDSVSDSYLLNLLTLTTTAPQDSLVCTKHV